MFRGLEGDKLATGSGKHREHDENEPLLFWHQAGRFGLRFSVRCWIRSTDVFEAWAGFVRMKQFSGFRSRTPTVPRRALLHGNERTLGTAVTEKAGQRRGV